MIKNIGKIAVLHLGLILAIGAATTVEASNITYKFTTNPSFTSRNGLNSSQPATNNNNNTTAILRQSISNQLNNSSQINSSNPTPSKSNPNVGNVYQVPTKTTFTPNTSVVLNNTQTKNNKIQPTSNDTKPTNQQNNFGSFYQNKATRDVISTTTTPVSQTIYPNNLFSYTKTNTSQTGKKYINDINLTEDATLTTQSPSLNFPQIGNTTTNKNTITGSSPIDMGSQALIASNTQKLSKCNVLLQQVIDDYIEMEINEKGSKESLMSEDY